MASTYRIVGWGYAGLCAAFVIASRSHRAPVTRTQMPTPRAAPTPSPTPAPVGSETNAAEWFRRAKPYCNSVEIATLQRGSAPPATDEGVGYHAACFALAGKIDDARHLIDELSGSSRARAANIVFEIGHPVADAGDDRSAGPIMELVVDYMPDHYMALYHAGMAEYMLGQRDVSRKNLTDFLRYYHEKDGWTSNAEQVLGRLNDPANAAADPRRPREP
ncbi:MAG TPA: hypothetical protein VK636_16865 [Gemmatimonadaceae bacterium]|nr:hypothetical protein [Gemmatimonadaceae bacterium]